MPFSRPTGSENAPPPAFSPRGAPGALGGRLGGGAAVGDVIVPRRLPAPALRVPAFCNSARCR